MRGVTWHISLRRRCSQVKSECSSLFRFYTKGGLARFYVDLRHDGLNKCRRITGDDPDLVRQKASAQMASWDEAWSKREEKESQRAAIESLKAAAEAKTEAARGEKRSLQGILAHAVKANLEFDWDSLRDHAPFPKKREFPKPRPTLPVPEEPPPKPNPVVARLGILDYVFPSRRYRKEAAAEEQAKLALRNWQARVNAVAEENRRKQKQYAHQVRLWENEETAFFAEWEAEKQGFLRRQKEKNEAVDRQMAAYAKGESGAVVDYCDMILSRSDYPDTFPQDYEIDYTGETKTLVVNYQLPSPEVMPRVKEVKYNRSRDELTEVLMDDKERSHLYDSVVYQITLRTLFELFRADAGGALEAIAFNGIVTSLDRAKGKDVSACIVSIFVKRDEFISLNLARVDPKACFKSLKGVGSSQLVGLAPVAPIMQMTREDKRFVQGRVVIDAVEEGNNLAAMDWEDFEHMIRELFEKEFSKDGGEVKVTRASRDGGVDAVVFDPDPIHGGKIVIQAKRYTNTVQLSAVRDLYGTVVNEGATKGILVSTADYGPDSYHFAKDKPIVLLNGANLLHLLQKHGYKARIDLKEAKRLLGEPLD